MSLGFSGLQAPEATRLRSDNPTGARNARRLGHRLKLGNVREPALDPEVRALA